MRYIEYKKSLYFLFISLVMFLPVSCGNYITQSKMELPDKYSRLLVYLHLEGNVKSSIDFTLKGAFIENLDSGQWEDLAQDGVLISSSKIGRSQIKLSEVILSPASYGRVRFDITSASVENMDMEFEGLTLREESFYFNAGINLEDKESHLLQLAWDTSSSIVKGSIFEPDIEVFEQRPVAIDLAVFVSNSGSNYVSVIDKDLERVVGAITVGRGPMGMALNYEGGRLYVVNTEDSTLSIVDVYSYDVLKTVDISHYGLKPLEVVFLRSDSNIAEGKLYIVNNLSNDVTVFDTETEKVLKTVQVGMLPSDLVLDKPRKELYVANKGSNSISILSGLSDTVSSTIDLGSSPEGIAIGSDMLYVFSGDSRMVSVLSQSTRSIVKSIPTSFSHKRGIRSRDNHMYVTNTYDSSISSFDDFDIFIEDLPVGASPATIGVDEGTQSLYVSNYGDGSVTIVDIVEQAFRELLFVGDGPYFVLIAEKYYEK